jgi:hypothetical protein
MATMIRFTPQLITKCRKLAALAVALSALLGATAQAQDFGKFTLKVTEKEMNLEHPSEMDWQKYIMWDLPFQRMTDRNTPFLELTNDSTSEAPITQFKMTIGDSRFNFSNGHMNVFAKLAKTTPGFDITSSSPTGDELIVNIGGGGLDPGDTIRFKIDLEVDAAFKGQFWPQPDYRTVLFDMNGLNVYDGNLQQFSSDDNAKATAFFTSGDVTFTVGPWTLPDELVNGSAAGFYNDNYRKYRDPDPIRTFLVIGTTQPIPEPGCISLAAIGLVGGMLTGRRPRRALISA